MSHVSPAPTDGHAGVANEGYLAFQAVAAEMC